MKNLLKLSISCLVLFIGTSAYSQQDPHYTQYFWNPLIVNSGYAGSNDVLSITFLARDQWVGLEGRPQTQTFSIHTPLANEHLAVGLSILHDKLGPTENTAAYADFAYRIRINENSRLALGLKAGVSMWKAGIFQIGQDLSDPAFGTDIANSPIPNFGASAYYWAENYFLGLAVPKLLENELTDGDVIVTQGSEKRHFFLMGGYVFDLSDNLKLKPTAIGKYVDGAPVSADLTLNFLIGEKLWLGGAYRTEDSFGVNVSYLITDQLRAGYGFDFTTSELKSYNDGSHEIMIGYDFIFNKDKILTPRYF